MKQASHAAVPHDRAVAGALSTLLLVCILGCGVGASAQEAVPPQSIAVEVAPGTDASATALPGVTVTGSTQNRAVAADKTDAALFPKIGATSYSLDEDAIASLPRGADTPLDKGLLRIPGVSYDSAVSNVDFHVRNEYANVQYRIDGIQLPEGVSGIGAVLDTSLIGHLSLLDGVLPAQYGLRTAAVIDITTKVQSTAQGSLGVEAGSRDSATSHLEYGGTAGATQYYVAGRVFRSDEGIENPAPTGAPLHDRTEQGKFFAYGSTSIGDAARLQYMTGASVGRYQIPTLAGQTPLKDFGSPTLDSSTLDENQHDRYAFGLVSLQASGERYDAQVSAFTRYAGVHFIPDVAGDLAFNDVAADVRRRSLLAGMQWDSAFRWSRAHTWRAGFSVTAESTHVDNDLTVLPLAADDTIRPMPTQIDDAQSKLGWNVGAYVQDEWKLDDELTLNAGVRFDALRQFVTAGQVSPRLALAYRPRDGTSLHAGYARYFTPPTQVYAAPSNIALFDRTTAQPVITSNSPARPERSNYIDVGIDQTVFAGLTVGLDAYLKRAKDFLDDGQFGQAVVFSQFNFARGRSKGVELKLDYRKLGFNAYLNLSANRTQAKDVVSNGYLFTDAAEYAYLAKNFIYTDDTQLYTASAGISYGTGKNLLSLSGVFGSGLRSGFANTDHVPGYVQLDAAVAREFEWLRDDQKAVTVRAAVINLLDRKYLLRSGDGVGEFAPQYGARRGFFMSVTQRL